MSGKLIILLLLCLISQVRLAEEPTFALPTPETSTFSLFLSIQAMVVTADASLRYLESIVLSTVIPDITQKIKTSTGSAEISLRNMVIEQFSVGPLSIDPDETAQVLNGFLPDTSFLLSFDYDYKQLNFPYKSESGTGTVSTVGMVITASMTSTLLEETGHLLVNADSLTFDIGEIDIDMQGGSLADLVRALNSMFSEIIEDLLSKSVEDFLRSIVDPALEDMSDLIYAKCCNYICEDTRVSANAIVKSTGIRTLMGGTFFYKHLQDLYQTPHFIGPIPDVQNTQGLQMQITRPCFESYISVLQQTPLLHEYHYFASGADENTMISYASMVQHFPVWAERYPVGTNANVFFTMHEQFNIEIMYTGLRMTMNYTVVANPVGVEDVTGLTSEVSVVLLGSIYWRDYHHTPGPIEQATQYLSIEASFVSAKDSINNIFDSEWLAGVVNSFLLPKLNWEFSQELFRVYEGFKYLENPTVTYNGDFVLVSADPV